MSRSDIKLPELGKDGGNEATVNFFFRGVGEEIKKDDDLVEMVTEKATFILPSPVSGRIVSIEVGENGVVKVGDVLAIVEIPD
jgi:pyruvate/2-oxoglutarate dehydrogenase complex dihydrolipoamide acyltransferase (E2) component